MPFPREEEGRCVSVVYLHDRNFIQKHTIPVPNPTLNLEGGASIQDSCAAHCDGRKGL